MYNLSQLRLPGKSGGWTFDKKICTDGQDCQILKIYARVARDGNAWN